MNLKEFDRIFYNIKNTGKYLERNYKTIGGLWTVDTWIKGEWKAQLLDEGYTAVIHNLETNDRWIKDCKDQISKGYNF